MKKLTVEKLVEVVAICFVTLVYLIVFLKMVLIP